MILLMGNYLPSFPIPSIQISNLIVKTILSLSKLRLRPPSFVEFFSLFLSNLGKSNQYLNTNGASSSKEL